MAIENWTPEDLKQNLTAQKNVFLKLWKKGCGPCKLSEPAVERVQADDKSGLIFAQISVTDFPEMLEIAETDVLPAFFIFRNGEMKSKFIGFKGLEKLKEFIKTH